MEVFGLRIRSRKQRSVGYVPALQSKTRIYYAKTQRLTKKTRDLRVFFVKRYSRKVKVIFAFSK